MCWKTNPPEEKAALQQTDAFTWLSVSARMREERVVGLLQSFAALVVLCDESCLSLDQALEKCTVQEWEKEKNPQIFYLVPQQLLQHDSHECSFLAAQTEQYSRQLLPASIATPSSRPLGY